MLLFGTQQALCQVIQIYIGITQIAGLALALLRQDSDWT
jgi:hypothetical protein